MGSSIVAGHLMHSDLTMGARGGTELLAGRLIDSVNPGLLEGVEIHLSRVNEQRDNLSQILWCHDLATDPAVQHLKNGGWKKYDLLIFVSHWQQYAYNAYLGVPFEKGTVIQNAITPFDTSVADPKNKPNDKIRLVYFSTPHRGLDILAAAFDVLGKEYGDKVELNVFSSFDLYGWSERDKPYADLFKRLEDMPNVNYSKSVDNDTIRKELARSHIFAYPSTWAETSCLCLIEAMCAGLTAVHSSLGALPETSMGLTNGMYGYKETPGIHASQFYNVLRGAIESHLQGGVDNSALATIANRKYGMVPWKFHWERVLSEITHK